jgi:hypothetical protein
MYPPPEATIHLPRQHYTTALRHRLHLPHPQRTYTTCQHQTAQTTCNTALDEYGHHATTCPSGGCLLHRHNALCDVLTKWLRRHGYLAQREAHIPELDDHAPDGAPRQAILDILTTGPLHRSYVDVTVTASTADALRLPARAQNDGQAARQREADKRHRYNHHPHLIPFALETHGRWGPTAEAWIRTLAPTAPEERATSIMELRYNLSATLQRANADAILTASP